MLLIDLLIYFVSFILIWAGTGLIVGSIDTISRKIAIPRFALSFVILGILTSTPELAVGLTSVAEGKPEIFVGNLLGGIVILFLLVIPILAIIGNGIKLDHKLDNVTIIFCLLVISVPSILVLDKRVTNAEGIILVLIYLFLVYFILQKEGFFSATNTRLLSVKSSSLINTFKILGGVAIVFISSNLIVDKTIFFAEVLKISPFYISLLALSIGTNLPELTIAVRAVISGRKDIAYGDYLGSASANTLLFGILSLLNSGEVLTATRFIIPFGFIAVALILFYFLARSKSMLSRNEGLVLLVFYILFIFAEVYKI